MVDGGVLLWLICSDVFWLVAGFSWFIVLIVLISLLLGCVLIVGVLVW